MTLAWHTEVMPEPDRSPLDAVRAHLESRRAGPDFRQRIRDRIEADREILRQLEAGPDAGQPFQCPCCGIVSHNPNDAEQGGYCGACHWFTGDPVPGPPHLEAPCEARTAALMREWRARG